MARKRMSKKRKRKKSDAGGSFMVSHRPHRAFSACLASPQDSPACRLKAVEGLVPQEIGGQSQVRSDIPQETARDHKSDEPTGSAGEAETFTQPLSPVEHGGDSFLVCGGGGLVLLERPDEVEGELSLTASCSPMMHQLVIQSPPAAYLLLLYQSDNHGGLVSLSTQRSPHYSPEARPLETIVNQPHALDDLNTRSLSSAIFTNT
ncbi:uncharacterized protein RHO25_012493 [Cercospora beticola]|uniref:Uncharacterized protein n=1 Tax=Cercospora beticola TaxID=122368 RepID=A0ABZ0P7G6_CERBT|nr:hypothetical protein RHO25_012493 [Cercospora beticola]